MEGVGLVLLCIQILNLGSQSLGAPEEEILTHTKRCYVNFAPQVIPDWIIRIPTAWVGLEEQIPGLRVKGRDPEKESGGRKEVTVE